MRRLLALLLLLASLLAPATAGAARPAKLRAFSSCQNLIAYGARHMDRVRSIGMGGGAGGGVVGRRAPAMGGDQEQSAGATPERAATVPDFSGTNVQEEGVDEPDTVKTDGSTLFVLRRGHLRAIDARSAGVRELGAIKLGDGNGGDHQMLLRGNRALVIWSDYSAGGDPVAAKPASTSIMPWQPRTVLAELDVSDPAAMRLVRSETVDGSFVSGRLHGRSARLVLRSTPAAVVRATSTRAARRLNRWLPTSTVRGRRGHVTRARRSAVSCRSVRRPSQFSGLDVLTVLTVDLAKGLPAVDAVAVMSDAETVYASAGSLYVATQRWVRALEAGDTSAGVPDGIVTAIHRFDVSDADRTTYRSTGAVPGFLLNQFSLSEHEGVLRAATTSAPPWFGDARNSESAVYALRDTGAGVLGRIGSVGGLGKGERIYAVRFLGELGYVVTFRQTDPLYVIDASSPTALKVTGELKILGYSAYLHPIAKDRLLGVGQDATEEGRRLGAQVSLFDVSDPAAPRRLQAYSVGTDSTEAEWDHHAFLWWAPADLAVLPVERYDEEPSFGAAGLRVRGDGVGLAGRIEHPARDAWMGRISRSAVVGDRLFTVSEAGVQATRLDGFAAAGWHAFPLAAGEGG